MKASDLLIKLDIAAAPHTSHSEAMKILKELLAEIKPLDEGGYTQEEVDRNKDIAEAKAVALRLLAADLFQDTFEHSRAYLRKLFPTFWKLCGDEHDIDWTMEHHFDRK